MMGIGSFPVESHDQSSIEEQKNETMFIKFGTNEITGETAHKIVRKNKHSSMYVSSQQNKESESIVKNHGLRSP
jgi:hypothetical protein